MTSPDLFALGLIVLELGLMRKIAADVCSVEKRAFNKKLLALCWDEFCGLFEGCADLLEMLNDLLNLDGPARSDKDYLCKNSIQTFVNFYSTNPRQQLEAHADEPLANAAVNFVKQQSGPLRRQAQPFLSDGFESDTHLGLQAQPISTTEQSLFDTEKGILQELFDERLSVEPVAVRQQDYENAAMQDRRLQTSPYHLQLFDSPPQKGLSTNRTHSPYKSLFPTDPRALAQLRERSSTPVKRAPQPSAQKLLPASPVRQQLLEENRQPENPSMQRSPSSGGIAKKKRKFVSRVELHQQTMSMRDKENSFVEKVPLTFQSSGSEAAASSRFRG